MKASFFHPVRRLPLLTLAIAAVLTVAASPIHAQDKTASDADAQDSKERRRIVIKIDGKEMSIPDATSAAIDKAMAAVHEALGSRDRAHVDVEEIRESIRKAVDEAGTHGTMIFRHESGERVEKGNPYSAREVREFKQTLGDGSVIQRQSTRVLARDRDGRTRQELRQPDGTARIFINDPVAKEAFILDPQKKTACRSGFDERAIHDCFQQMKGDWKPLGFAFSASNRGGIAMMSAQDDIHIAISPRARIIDMTRQFSTRERSSNAAPLPPLPPLPPAPGTAGNAQVSREKKTAQPYEGLAVETDRSVEVIAAGAIGNSKALETINERYYSPELKMTVYHRRSDPRNGESLYRMTDIKRSEPDAALFRIPAGYGTSEGKR